MNRPCPQTWLITTALALLSGCGHAQVDGPGLGGDYTIVVHNPDNVPLPGAEIFLVSGERERLGVTDEVGILRFEFADLPDLALGVVLVCKQGYYCAGWLLDEDYFTPDRQWLYIELAREVIR